MSSLPPSEPFDAVKLAQLYPKDLSLDHVQIYLRHGERTPSSYRFLNTGLPKYWPYCQSVEHFVHAVLGKSDASEWKYFKFRRRHETLGTSFEPIIASGPDGKVSGLCHKSELTDVGRLSMRRQGERLRELYVNHLGFMPKVLINDNILHLRASAIPRAVESLQEAMFGMYPSSYRSATLPPPEIVTREKPDEIIYPNVESCSRLRELIKAFGDRAALVWNNTPEMKYVNDKIGKWMPSSSPKVAIDSKPRLSGIMDTINSSMAHGPATRLPKEFYDEKLRNDSERMLLDEWFSGYKESREYRQLGMGPLALDIVNRLLCRVYGETQNKSSYKGASTEVERSSGRLGHVKFSLFGCHDTTLIGLLTSLGAFKNEGWSPFASQLAIEMFKDKSVHSGDERSEGESPGLLSRIWCGAKVMMPFVGQKLRKPFTVAQMPYDKLSDCEKKAMDGYYVRLTYNNRVLQVPECAKAGAHWRNDTSFCTLSAFKSAMNEFSIVDWKSACTNNLGKAGIPKIIELAGKIE